MTCFVFAQMFCLDFCTGGIVLSLLHIVSVTSEELMSLLKFTAEKNCLTLKDNFFYSVKHLIRLITDLITLMDI